MPFMSVCNEPTQSPISDSTPTSETSTPTPVVTPTPAELKPLIFQKSTDMNFTDQENKTSYVGAVIVPEGEDPSAYMETDRLMLRKFIYLLP